MLLGYLVQQGAISSEIGRATCSKYKVESCIRSWMFRLQSDLKWLHRVSVDVLFALAFSTIQIYCERIVLMTECCNVDMKHECC